MLVYGAVVCHDRRDMRDRGRGARIEGIETMASIKRCVLCACKATGTLYGLAVCDYHLTHGEDHPQCQQCKG